MQTRIIQTRFYKDAIVRKLDRNTQHFFLYLLTCEHINISGIFELPDDYICLEIKLFPEELSESKRILELYNRAFFKDGWIYIVNAEKNNNYRKSPKNEIAYQREVSRIPKGIFSYFEVRKLAISDTSIDSSIDTTYKSEIRNHKSETINQKPTNSSIDTSIGWPLTRNQIKTLKDFIKWFNKEFKTDYKYIDDYENKYQYILSSGFSIDNIFTAIENMKANKFMSGDNDSGDSLITLKYILDPKNINEWLNKKSKKDFEQQRDIEDIEKKW